MDRRRALLMMQVQGGLPSEYQQIDWLESTGTQYIDTGIKPFPGIGFECEYLTNNSLSNTGIYGCLFGGRQTTGINDFQLTTYSPPEHNEGMFRYGSATQYDAGIANGIKQKATLKQLLYTAPDGTTNAVTDYNWSENTKNIFVFGLNNGGTFAQSGNGCRIYSLVIFNGANIYARFVPCVRKAGSKPGMYDTVSKTFYTNAGTGEFIIPS